MTSVIPEASKTMPDPRDQRAALYRLYNADGTLLYIGVTGDPDQRFKQHRDSKPWWPQVAQKTVEWHPARNDALTAEAAVVEAEAPIYNIEHNPAYETADPHRPPADMPADRVAVLQQTASTMPADEAESFLRAAFNGFLEAQRDERATSTPATQEQRDSDSDPGVVVRAWDAIDALFAASPNPELTRQGLREYVDITADRYAHIDRYAEEILAAIREPKPEVTA